MKTLRTLLPALILLATVPASVIRVEGVKGSTLFGRMLDEGTAVKGEAHFLFSRELTDRRGPVTQVKDRFAALDFGENAAQVKVGDYLVDRDWYAVLRLLEWNGDIKAVNKALSGVGGPTAFPGMETNTLEQFKGQMEAVLLRRASMVESQQRKDEESSLSFLYLTTADYYFKFDNDYAKALDYYKKGLAKSPALGTLQVKALGKMGDCYVNQKRFPEALSYYQKAVSIMEPEADFYAADLKALKRRIEILQKAAAPAAPPPANDAALRAKIVQTARSLVDTRWADGEVFRGKSFLYDCQGTVARIYWAHDIDLTRDYGKPEYQGMLGGVPRIFATYKGLGKVNFNKLPKPADLVFFDNTWDYNGNRRMDDSFTHIGIVESVDPDGTVSVIHHCSKGIKVYKMNLLKPTVYQDESGKVLNNFIRRQSSDDPQGTSYVLGAYFSGFAAAAEK
ncbi:MAG: tetratricopeptide repeat protein [Spirochaetes bacterium]|nr:tetratricopeptide repeat protein [Spirochaetota bacterium]